MRKAVHKKIGALETLTIEGKAGGPCVILFHGYGADSSDLTPLSAMMGLSDSVTWVFPNGPLDVIIAPGIYGNAWFQIDMRRLESAMVKGEPVDMSSTTPPGLENARQTAALLYEDLLATHSSVVLGGFSQGAMLAIELTLSHKKKPAGLVLMSATLICKERWKKMASTCRDLTFIQSHGKNDVLLGFNYAEDLYNLLTANDLFGEFIGFNGGHEIPPKVIEKIGQYLASVFKNSRHGHL
ncbi:MAG: hypothetical protein A2Z20_12390 [Bdellovibrionales bacterium RBG_16_40_8]|nr:MAG: hypothetical protein A2Z20_12390 [Bdellovibrionales bacterium RBG_16_40_8]